MNQQDKKTVEEIKNSTTPVDGDMMSQIFNDLFNGNCSNVFVLLGVIERLELKCNNLELPLSAWTGQEADIKVPADEIFEIATSGLLPGTLFQGKKADTIEE